MPDQPGSGGKPQESNIYRQTQGPGPSSSILTIGSAYRDRPAGALVPGPISHPQESQQVSSDLKCDISCTPYCERVKLEGLASCAALKLGKDRCVGISELGSDLFEFLFLLRSHIFPSGRSRSAPLQVRFMREGR